MLSQDAVWNLFNPASETTPDTRQWFPFAFTPATVPGFAEYKATYSHFRILKAKLYISRNVVGAEGVTNNYLVVGSRPFAAVTRPGNTAAYPYSYVPPQKEADLRQARWQKIYYPSTVRNVVTASFHPYTLMEAYGPMISSSGGNLWPRIWEGRKWMPFSWIDAPRTSGGGDGVAFYGPYMVIDTSTGELPKPGTSGQVGVECTLRISVNSEGRDESLSTVNAPSRLRRSLSLCFPFAAPPHRAANGNKETKQTPSGQICPTVRCSGSGPSITPTSSLTSSTFTPGRPRELGPPQQK